jgi:methylmalonyl-CoA mutase C-terminal domain/subunit
MKKDRQIKVLIAKCGLDGHDRGVRVLAEGLRDQGMEVVYSGLRRTPEEIAELAHKKGVDVVGLSSLAGAHNSLLPQVVEAIRRKGMSEVLIIAGGFIPAEDIPFLEEKGISAIFGPGTPIKQIADYIRENVKTYLNIQ